MNNGRLCAPVVHRDTGCTPSFIFVTAFRSPDILARSLIETTRRLEANGASVFIRSHACTVDASRLHTNHLTGRNPAWHRQRRRRLRCRQTPPWALTAVEPNLCAIERTLPCTLTHDEGILNGRRLRVTQRDADLSIDSAHDRPISRPITGHQHFASPAPATGSQLGSATIQRGHLGLGHRRLVGHRHIPNPARGPHPGHRRRRDTRRAGDRQHAREPYRANQGIGTPPHIHDGTAAAGFPEVEIDTASDHIAGTHEAPSRREISRHMASPHRR